MSHTLRTIAALIAATTLLGGQPVAAERLFRLTDDGQTFLYPARPGDHPSGVAEMFGVPRDQLDAFLAANGITDATRVAPGTVYRVPNASARTLGERVTALEADRTRLTRELARAEAQVTALGGEAKTAQAVATDAETRAAQRERIAALWPWAQAAIVLLLIAAGFAAAIARAAAQRTAQAERYARALAREMEEKRQNWMVERQESGRRMLDLENRIRALEAQLGPRVVISGR
jgi:hypothetical protein